MNLGRLVGPLLVVAAVAALGYLAWQRYGAESPEEPAAEAETTEPAEPAPPQYPIERVAPETPAEEHQPLPELGESDTAALAAIAGLVGRETAPPLLLTEHVIERLVVTLDNLPSRRLPLNSLPVHTAPGRFQPGTGADGQPVLDESNFARYRDYIDLVAAVDVDKLVAEYVRAYPLFQQAYRGLGYPEGHFNDRLVAVIDHLLAAPRVDPPIALVPEKGGYTYADPALDRLSAGQKLLVRIGPANAAVVKDKLREIRAKLAGQDLPQEPATAPAP